MKLGTAIQQPAERLSYTINYASALTDGDNIESAYATVSPTGLTVENVSTMDPKVRFWVTGGTPDVTYKVTITTNTADGRVFQDEVIFRIRDI